MLKISSIDLIGKNILIKTSSDISKSGLSGVVLYETKNNIILREENTKSLKKINKKEIIDFEIY